MNNRLYKTIDRETLDKLNIVIKRNYYYYNSDNIKKNIEEIQFDKYTNVFKLEDPDFEWNNKMHSLYIDIELSMNNTNLLFDSFCCKDAILGIGIEWKPEKSRIRNCKKIGELCNNIDNYNFKVEKILIDDLNSNVDFSWLIYVAKPGNDNSRKMYGNSRGLILGDGPLWKIIVEGEGSVFPIREISLQNEPLWSYYCDFDDIYEDSFSDENIKIIINKNHRLYQYIHHSNPKFDKNVFIEVLSSALVMLILEIKNKNKENRDEYNIDFSKKGQKNSIYSVLKYYNDTFNFNINGTMDEMFYSIKLFFERKFKI